MMKMENGGERLEAPLAAFFQEHFLSIYESAFASIGEKVNASSTSSSSASLLANSPSQSGLAMVSNNANPANASATLLWKKTKLLRGLGRLLEYLDVDSGFPKIFRYVID
jgi:hypothetical protein